MDRKEVCEFLVQNEVPGELMAYADHGELGCAAVASNGMKFVFSAEYLAQAEPKAEAARAEASPQKQTGRGHAPTTKRRATKKRTTTRKKRTTSK